MAQNELVFAPLGGIGEIGMNLSIYGFGDERRRQWLIVDCGVSFASEELLPGIDLILPDIRFLIEHKTNGRSGADFGLPPTLTSQPPALTL